MTRPAIRVDSISKQFRLGGNQTGYRTLRETVSSASSGMWKLCRRQMAPSHPIGEGLGGDARLESRAAAPTAFWALKDVSFQVQPGEVVGIIGRNGAGKSTLLKILSRVTEPTSGRIELRGRVGSLLEVGTGFHPELTGRENIYMNGSILGMSRREIARSFDEIVAFAEIEQFLETPVKRYSSGMYVRLAFAVAANLEPEILIVDEVLAVGDAAFQRKCTGKIGDVAHSGRTVLLVSHNMATISNLCEHVAVLENGRVAFYGSTSEGIARHTASGSLEGGEVQLDLHPHRRTNSSPIFRAIRSRNSNGFVTDQFLCGESMSFELDVDPLDATTNLHFAVIINDAYGSKLFTAATYLSDSDIERVSDPQRFMCSLDELPLPPGRYSVTLCAGPLHQFDQDIIEQAISFDVLEADYYGNGRYPHPAGCFLIRSRWSQKPYAGVGSNSLLSR